MSLVMIHCSTCILSCFPSASAFSTSLPCLFACYCCHHHLLCSIFDIFLKPMVSCWEQNGLYLRCRSAFLLTPSFWPCRSMGMSPTILLLSFSTYSPVCPYILLFIRNSGLCTSYCMASSRAMIFYSSVSLLAGVSICNDVIA